jgi:hypothetical protein
MSDKNAFPAVLPGFGEGCEQELACMDYFEMAASALFGGE